MKAKVFGWAVFLTLIGYCSNMSAGPESQANHVQKFFKRVNAYWKELSVENYSVKPTKLKQGEVGFLLLTELIRGQPEISVDNIFFKMREKEKDGDFKTKKDGTFKLSYDEGKSSVSKADPIKVIRGPQGYVILDGHHDWYLSFYLGAETIAVEVVEDLHKLSPVEFWQQMKTRQKVYLSESAEVLAACPPAFNTVKDNPNRYLVSLLARKVKMDSTGKKVKNQKGPENALWLKINDSMPYIEFDLAKILSDNGIEYKAEWGDQIPDEIVEKAREIFVAAKKSHLIPKLEFLYFLETKEQAKTSFQSKEYLQSLIDANPAILTPPFQCIQAVVSLTLKTT